MARLSMEMRIERIKILAQIDKLEKERCDRCNGAMYKPGTCCEANSQVVALGKVLDVLVNPRVEHKENHDWAEYMYWEEVAVQNGISKELYRKRVMVNMSDYERAAKLPELNERKSRYTDRHKEIARANGIGWGMVRQRVGRGWTIADAISRPKGYDKRKKQYK